MIIARKILSYCVGCYGDCICAKVMNLRQWNIYIYHMSWGGLSKTSEKLSDYIAQSLSYLDATSPLIRQSNALSRLAWEHVLKEFITRPDIVASTKIECFSVLLARCPISSSMIKGKSWMSQLLMSEITHSRKLPSIVNMMLYACFVNNGILKLFFCLYFVN